MKLFLLWMNEPFVPLSLQICVGETKARNVNYSFVSVPRVVVHVTIIWHVLPMSGLRGKQNSMYFIYIMLSIHFSFWQNWIDTKWKSIYCAFISTILCQSIMCGDEQYCPSTVVIEQLFSLFSSKNFFHQTLSVSGESCRQFFDGPTFKLFIVLLK